MTGQKELPIGRFMVEDLVDHETIAELILMHRICSTPGYRENYTSTLFPCAPPWAFRAYVKARDAVREAAEELFGLPLSICMETSGTAGWMKGAEIPAHADNARTYLSKRHISAALFLNEPGPKTFIGGEFTFCNQPDQNMPTNLNHKSWPAYITPKRGTCLIFSSGTENMHSVTQITTGTRYSMLFWMSTDMGATEDKIVISRLMACPLPINMSVNERLFGVGPQTKWGHEREPHLVKAVLQGLNLTIVDNNVVCMLSKHELVLGPVESWRVLLAQRAYELFLCETKTPIPFTSTSIGLNAHTDECRGSYKHVSSDVCKYAQDLCKICKDSDLMRFITSAESNYIDHWDTWIAEGEIIGQNQ
eukprot:CFRG0615T1